MPPVDRDNAASGRCAPDPLAPARQPDEFKPGPTDVT